MAKQAEMEGRSSTMMHQRALAKAEGTCPKGYVKNVKNVKRGRGEGETELSVVLRYAQRAIYTRGDPKP